MIKKHDRWIALLVAITFAWLLLVSTMPLAAAGETKISDAQMLEKSFGTYISEMKAAGADFEVVEEV